jgi:phosphoglycolate phosphatase/AHBA synthesis associated protein
VPKPPRAVLFDLDGVLVKSEEAWFRAVEESGVRFRGSPVTREEFTPTFGQGTAADIEVFRLSTTVKELDAFYEDAFIRHLSTVWVNPDAEPLLRALVGRETKTALVTNSVSKVADATLKHARLAELLPVRATSDRVPRAKPAPDLVLLACRELGVTPADAWMVGDSRFDREAARIAGAHFIGLGLDGDERIERLNELDARLR